MNGDLLEYIVYILFALGCLSCLAIFGCFALSIDEKKNEESGGVKAKSTFIIGMILFALPAGWVVNGGTGPLLPTLVGLFSLPVWVIALRFAQQYDKAKEAQQEAAQTIYHVHTETFSGTTENEDFGFSADAFNDSEPSPSSGDGHHPADKKFWNVVNDPAASDQERKTALEKIMKRQKQKTISSS